MTNIIGSFMVVSFVVNILLSALGLGFSLIAVVGAVCLSCIIIVSTYRFLKNH